MVDIYGSKNLSKNYPHLFKQQYETVLSICKIWLWFSWVPATIYNYLRHLPGIAEISSAGHASLWGRDKHVKEDFCATWLNKNSKRHTYIIDSDSFSIRSISISVQNNRDVGFNFIKQSSNKGFTVWLFTIMDITFGRKYEFVFNIPARRNHLPISERRHYEFWKKQRQKKLLPYWHFRNMWVTVSVEELQKVLIVYWIL